jgi:exonuclease SbcC
MITKVTLKNWRSHEFSELNFDAGVNLLVGIIGSGKTSVLDAICFALFGTFPTLHSKKIKLEDLLMSKPLQKENCEVRVSFVVDGKSYTVSRVIERGKGTTFSELKEDGKILESPNTSRVSELIEKILKVDYELFSKVIYSEQNALDYFLTLPKGQRMKKIDELLMIDKFEKARANTVSLINKIVEKKEAKQIFIERVDFQQLQKNLSLLKAEVDNALNEKNILEKEIEEILQQKQQVEKEVSELRKIKEQFEVLKREESAITSAIEETHLSLKKLEPQVREADKSRIENNLYEISRAIKDLESFLKESQNEYERLHAQAVKTQTEMDLLKRERINILEEQLKEKLRMQKELASYEKITEKDLESEMEEKKKLIERFVGEIEVLRMKIQDLQEILEQISSVGSKCPICESKLTKEKKAMLIKQKSFQIKTLQENLQKLLEKKAANEKDLHKLEEMAVKLEEILSEIADLDSVKTELENAKNIFSILSESNSKLKNEVDALKKKIEMAENKLKSAVNQKQTLEILRLHLADYEEKRRRIEDLLRKREEITKHITELEKSFFVKDLGNLEIFLQNLSVKEKEKAVKIAALNQLLKERGERIKELETNLKIFEKEKEEILKFDKLLYELKIFERALIQTQEEMRKEFVTSVNYTMNSIWPDLYPYQDFVGVRLAIEEGDYVLQLQERTGRWINVEGIASGGERSLAALTLRIAFALVLAPQLKWLVLDEPTANLDVKSVEVLAEALSQRIGSYVDQIFIITHDEKLESAATGYAYRLHREKAKDGITKVTLIQ